MSIVEEPTSADFPGLSEFALRLQRAPSTDEVRRVCLDELDQLLPASAYGFLQFDTLLGQPVLQCLTIRHITARFVADYRRLAAERDALFLASVCGDVPEDAALEVSGRSWRESEVYNLVAADGLENSMIVPFYDDGRLIGSLFVARSPADGAFSSRDYLVMATAKRHIEAALARAIGHESTQEQLSLLRWALDQVEAAVTVTDLAGHVIFENRALRRLAGNNGSSLDLRPLVRSNVGKLRRGAKWAAASAESVPPGGADRVIVKSAMYDEKAVISFVYRQRRDVRAPVDQTPLSPREREIVEWVSRGMTNRQIAEEAFISENTVREHLKRVFAKLDVHSRAQLIQTVWQNSDFQ